MSSHAEPTATKSDAADFSVDQNITRTAIDSLCAKMSALIHGNYHITTDENVLDEDNLYHFLLKNMYMGVATRILCNDVAYRIKYPPAQQSPLINAGYFVRMSLIASLLQRFLRRNIEENVQILILGAGLDTVGLWALSLAQSIGLLNSEVFELDCSTICMCKRQILIQQQIENRIIVEENHDARRGSIVFKGRYFHSTNGKNVDSNTSSNYILAQANFNCLVSLQKALDQLDLSPQKPTLVLSELVLCYLERDSTDELLDLICKKMFHHHCNARSVFISYEPMGSTEKRRQGDLNFLSYQEQYFALFTAKLNNNKYHGNQEKLINKPNVNQFHSLGEDCHDICQRISNFGFECTKSLIPSDLWKQINRNKEVLITEPFDEHAALINHLRSYAITFGFSTLVDVVYASELIHGYAICYDSTATERRSYSNSSNILVTPIFQPMECQARSLFQEAYASYVDHYPSIRKLVKESLKHDMKMTTSDTMLTAKLNAYDRTIPSQDNENKNDDKNQVKTLFYLPSAIREKYRQKGGDFWIATITNLDALLVEENRPVTTTTGTIDHLALSSHKKSQERLWQLYSEPNKEEVVGAIGIRRFFTSAQSEKDTVIYEVQRLVVKDSYRKRGIGRSLLYKAIDFIIYHKQSKIMKTKRKVPLSSAVQLERHQKPGIRLIAVTPSMMEAANRFYKALGFALVEEKVIKNILFNTYSIDIA
jgi:O-methyltransferase involved in polyketide biosynthesis/GNAT superfamily N-acetyltransferase